MMMLRRILPLFVPAFVAGCATAPADPPTCPTAAETQAWVQRYLALTPMPTAPAALTMEGAACGAKKAMAALEPTHGKVVGYKAGLTNPAVQQRFGIGTPLRGTLLAKMLLPDNAEVPARFGARPFFEPDLVVEVGSAAIHDATTPQQVLASLRAVVPFIELPDVLVEDPTKITAPALVLNNVGARLGVLGARVPVRNDAAFADALRDMTVRAADGTGKTLAEAKGTAILGHPLNAVIWLAAELKKSGVTLQPGDLLSLGAFGSGPVAAGGSVRVSYEGLPGNPAVSVRFK
ncbi:MAG: fumarylacetoacetate hydrolase [Rubrivivax sp.]|nr:fumarylacetoacetate hydrolase [Rubrivivax sp.]